MSEHQCLSEKQDVTVIHDDPLDTLDPFISSKVLSAHDAIKPSAFQGFSYQLKAGNLACSRILFIVDADFEAWKQTLLLQ